MHELERFNDSWTKSWRLLMWWDSVSLGFFCDDDDGFFYQKPFRTEN